ncbi:GAF domain-containing protein [Vacuolonema iberomarrocanum]|uniref:GAF domain-containing protein n=1 Tax=Vacuolonema iberomarrocanum TaxID=3454632 RepID=UPI003F6E0E15
MSASPPHLPDRDQTIPVVPSSEGEVITVEVQVEPETNIGKVVRGMNQRQGAVAEEPRETIDDTESAPEPQQPSPSEGKLAIADRPPSGTGLAAPQGSFSNFLAPLTQESFKEVVTGVEEKLKVVNQTLTMLDAQGFDQILEEMLSSITFKTAELLNADRASIFILDEEKHELYSIVAKGDGESGTLEIRIPADKGIAGEVATFKRVVNIPYDFYDDPRSAFAKQKEQETGGYRTYTMLALPLLSKDGDLVAVVQLLNKLKQNLPDPNIPLEQKIDQTGFCSEDERVFKEFEPSIRLIIESSRSFYRATQKNRAASALIAATESLSRSSLDLDETLKRVMDEAKKLMNADRSTLWLIDREHNEIWTKIEGDNGALKELRLPIGTGFAGHVAETREVLIIPYDLYDHPDSSTSKTLDQANGYRTCSLLCMPVFADGDLIGVTQLVNKVKPGDFPDYNPADWPTAPDCWRASFNRTDQEFMEAFNIQAGVALKNAKLFARVKQQEQTQRDMLRSLTNGVFSIDRTGRIIAANESAKELVGLAPDSQVEKQFVRDLVQLEKGDFDAWIERALEAKDEKSRQQYYPDLTLKQANGANEHSINLSINTIADATDISQVSGVLIVMEDISDEKRLKLTMSRYMSEEIARQLFENPDAAKMGGDRKEVSVLFSDIRSYTTLTESMTAEDVVIMLNEYFESMVDAVFHYKGTLDKYIGDAIMAVYGSPLPLDDHAWMAVQTAVEMRKRLVEFNTKRKENNLTPIRIGIGLNSDTVISGNIGSSRRMEFTAIGDGVNLGSRLESASKQYGTDIIISEYTYAPCRDRVWARELDRVRVKGKNKPVSVYELVGLQSDPLPDKKKQQMELYEQGREHYLNRRFTKALSAFGSILEDIDSKDKASEIHLKRINHWLSNPPTDETWDNGVVTLDQK